MGALKGKLTSQRGSSFLLALLFLLICMMVSASILMAAVSNAGKHRSNMEEHQSYLVLSSAVSALCDELNRTEYQAKYKYWVETRNESSPDGTVNVITRYHFQQLEGVYQHKEDGDSGYLKPILLPELDRIFGKKFTDKWNNGSGVAFTTFKTKAGAVLLHRLTVSPPAGLGVDRQTVEMELSVEESSCVIFLTAALGDDHRIQAELRPESSVSLSDTPALGGENTTAALRWKITAIKPGEETAP